MNSVKLKKYIKICILILCTCFSIVLILTGILGVYDKLNIADQWSSLTVLYLGIAAITFIPIIKSLLLNDTIILKFNGNEIDSTQFSDENKEKLKRYNLMMMGILKFWKKNAVLYKSVHYYCVIWTTVIAVLMPILIQALPQGGKMILTIISAHSAILIAFHKGLKIESNYKSYRLCEAEYYDEYRKIIYSNVNGSSIEIQNQIINNFIEKVNSLRKIGRTIEIDNMPSIQQQNYDDKEKYDQKF